MNLYWFFNENMLMFLGQRGKDLSKKITRCICEFTYSCGENLSGKNPQESLSCRLYILKSERDRRMKASFDQINEIKRCECEFSLICDESSRVIDKNSCSIYAIKIGVEKKIIASMDIDP